LVGPDLEALIILPVDAEEQPEHDPCYSAQEEERHIIEGGCMNKGVIDDYDSHDQ
jgi:hypothetical protein